MGTFRSRAPRLVAAVLGAAAVEIATYPMWRQWCLHWGATGTEAARPLPGDELLGDPDLVTTRAVGIDASPEAVWPWIAQMGPGRAGAYTYDWIENLAGLDMHSADEILPQFQHLTIGDSWKLGPHGAVLRVAALDPSSHLVLRSDDGSWVWAFVLVREHAGTRLLSRNRIRQPSDSWPLRALWRFVMEPGSLVMERKMLLGIKARSERTSLRPLPDSGVHESATGRHQLESAPSAASSSRLG